MEVDQYLGRSTSVHLVSLMSGLLTWKHEAHFYTFLQLRKTRPIAITTKFAFQSSVKETLFSFIGLATSPFFLSFSDRGEGGCDTGRPAHAYKAQSSIVLEFCLLSHCIQNTDLEHSPQFF